jgi:hypothetical protein
VNIERLEHVEEGSNVMIQLLSSQAKSSITNWFRATFLGLFWGDHSPLHGKTTHDLSVRVRTFGAAFVVLWENRGTFDASSFSDPTQSDDLVTPVFTQAFHRVQHVASTRRL